MSLDITATALHLTNLARHEREPTSEDVDRLAQFLEYRTLTSAGADPDGELVSTDYPGYLKTCSGPETVFVPFQLASVFPSREILREAVDVARSASVVEHNPICVSGSTTFLGKLREIGDLDFCEYHLDDPRILPAALSHKCADDAPLPLIELKCGRERIHHPWEAFGERIAAGAFEELPPTLPAHKIKLDMFSNGGLGPLPTTSVVLALGPNREAGHARESFAFQEAVITRSGPPRILHDPASFSHYCGWLLAQAKSLVNYEGTEKPASVRAPKALKRLLSLLLVLGDTDTVEEVLDGLDQTSVQQMVRAGKLTELIEMAALAGSETRTLLENAIERIRREPGSLTEDATQEAAEITLEIARSIVTTLERRLDSIGELK